MIDVNKITKVINSILNEIQDDDKEYNNICNFETELKDLIKSMINVTDVSMKFLEYGINIYLNGYSICSIYHNKRYEITKVVFYSYDISFNTYNNYNDLIEVLNNLQFLDMNKIKSLIQKKYLNPKKIK